MKRAWSTVVAAGLIASATGCEHPDWSRPLPNGYRLVRANPHQIAIADTNGRVRITPTILHWGTDGTIVYGETAKQTYIPDPDDIPGYFFLNTVTGARSMGLSQAAWRDSLRRHGLRGEPVLLPPREKD